MTWLEKGADDEIGMIWWNSLSERERAEWSRAAGNTGVAADAWAAFRASQNHHGASLETLK